MRTLLSIVKYEDYMLPCLNKKLTGIDCPGCGMQRSIVHISQGEFEQAFYMYPAIYTLILLLASIVIFTFIKYEKSTKIIVGLIYVNAAIIIVNYLIKIFTNGI